MSASFGVGRFETLDLSPKARDTDTDARRFFVAVRRHRMLRRKASSLNSFVGKDQLRFCTACLGVQIRVHLFVHARSRRSAACRRRGVRGVFRLGGDSFGVAERICRRRHKIAGLRPSVICFLFPPGISLDAVKASVLRGFDLAASTSNAALAATVLDRGRCRGPRAERRRKWRALAGWR